MSRNYNLRHMADKLPKTPNLHNGRPQRNMLGGYIEANHFRRLKKIQSDCKKRDFASNSEQTFKALNAYCQMVVRYSELAKQREKATYKWPLIFLVASIIAIIYKYFIL